MLRPAILSFVFYALCVVRPAAGQSSAVFYDPPIEAPAFASGSGPLVVIDQAHNNFHTAGGRFRPFADVLRRDGYRVDSLTTRFTAEAFRRVDILVISNALHPSDVANWTLPNPSAFAPEEIDAVVDWVSGGGSLLLIADHMPFPGAAAMLAEAFGFRFINGFAFQRPQRGIFAFTRAEGRLMSHPITDGGTQINDRFQTERITSITTFTGQGFHPAPNAETILGFDSTFVSLNPVRAWQFDEDTPTLSLEHLVQGAVLRYGCGRVAVFGEAAMFSAQMAGPNLDFPVGLNSPDAEQNLPFLRNVMLWLSGTVD